MKKYLKYILLAAITFGFAACVEEEWTPGEFDVFDCHGLFFPQEQAKDYTIEPTDATKAMAFSVERTEVDDEAYVPYEIISNVEDFFELVDAKGEPIEEIYFDEGQKKATIRVRIAGDYELGEKYTCTIKVSDPQYVSQYSLSSSELTFSVTVMGWNYVGKGLWRDDLFSGFAAAIGAKLKEPNHEKEVEIYERADLKGFYKIEGVYTAEFMAYMADGNADNAKAYADFCPALPIYVNAVNPDKVYIDIQFAFYDPSNQYGEIYLASDVDEVMGAGYGNGRYGKVKNGVITFPKEGLIAYVPAANGMAYANAAGKHRIVLPGATPYDCSLSLDFSPAKDGVLPVEFTLGPDVAKVYYQVFDGHLNDVDMVSKLEEVKSGKNVKELNASGVYDFTADKSALYTMIACSFDAEGNYHEYDVIRFGYDTAADPKDVDINLGLIVSDKHALTGLTSENSMEFYLYGTGITKASAAIFKMSQYADFKETIEYNVQYAPTYALDKYQLDSLNKVGFSGLVGNLEPGVEYCLIVYADNGYHSGFFTATASTEGVYNLMNTEFDVFDLPERLQPVTHDDYIKEWEIWSLDPYNAKNWGRSRRGTAKFTDAPDVMYDEDRNITKDPAKADYIMDYLSLSGMHANVSATLGIEDEIDFEYYEGFVYTLMTPIPSVQLKADHIEKDDNGKDMVMNKKGTTVYPTNAYLFFAQGMLNANLENGAMIGGFATEEKDVIAFIGNPSTTVGSYGFSYVAMQLCYFLSEKYEGDGALISTDCHAYPLLIAPGSKYASAPESEVSKLAAPEACNAVSLELQKTRRNFVETESGYIKSTIDMVRDMMPRNYMQNVIPVKGIGTAAVADYTMKKSDSVMVKDNDKAEGFIERIIR